MKKQSMVARKNMDEIRIENLEVYAYHGVYQEETEKGQPFFVNAVLYTDTTPAALTDELTLATNYGDVCHFISEWMKEHTCQLIETVAENVAREILLRYPLILEVDLEIRKPKAPIGLPFGCVSVKIHRSWHTVYLSIGSNMGDRQQYLEQAIDALRDHAQIKVGRVSEWVNTKPYGEVEQQDFLNGIVEIHTLLTPQELLEELHRIEAAAGRERLVHWGPRTLDLDIVFYDDLVYEAKDLTIPHVDMANRYFVLKPLSQMIPYYVHPVIGKNVNQLLQELNSAE